MPELVRPSVFLFDWGDTLMLDDPAQAGPMAGWPAVNAMPGARETMLWAKAHGRLGIASGAADSGENDIRAALSRVDLNDGIEFVFCRCTLGFGKTDPRFWQAVLTALQMPPRQVVMIGDNYVADVAAPQAAGLQAIWFNWRGEAPRACPTITSLQELPKLFC